jgi:RNA polymerase sigma factor (sigma-70 family)
MVSLDELARRMDKEMFKKSLLGVAYKLTRRTEVSEDIAYETIEEILDLPVEKLIIIENLEQFARTIAFRRAVKWLNDNKNKSEKPPVNSMPDIVECFNPLIKEDLKEIILAVNTYRDEPDKTIFRLFCEGYKYEETAAFINESEAYVRRRIFEIRKWLRKHFKKDGSK